MTSVRDTSLMAWTELLPTLGKRQLKVLNAIRQLNLNGCCPTDMEIVVYLGLQNPNYVRPRRNELMKMKAVVDAGKRKCKITDRMAHTWRAT